MTYAEDACDKCGKYLPRKDFHVWSEDVVVSRESDTQTRFASGALGYREGKTTYKRITRRLCPACWAEREEERRLAAEAAAETAREKARADGRRAITIAGIVGALLVAVVAAAVLRPAAPTNEAAAGASSNEIVSTNEAISPPAAPLDVAMAVSASGSTQPIVTGTTNLPEGTILMVDLSGPFPDCTASASCEVSGPTPPSVAGITASVVVHAGRFLAGPTWSPALRPGIYKLWIQTAFSSFQPPAVQSAIGDKGQYMQGDLVDACPPTTAQTPTQLEAQAELGHVVCFQRQVTLAEDQPEPANETVSAPPPEANDGQRPPLSAAVSQALATGQPTPWSEGSESGLVSVGASRLWRGRLCRSYGFTTNGVRSPVVISCQAADGSWHPSDTYTNATADR